MTIAGAAELAARTSYGRLLAILAARSRDIAAAEDALSQAFVAALEQWPRDGVPTCPDAWLLTAARRRMIDGARRARTRDAAAEALLALAPGEADDGPAVFPDDRAKLLFCCAHPAIDAAVHTPLMLQTVLGLDAERIAGAMLVSPKTMGQRLWRAKTKIRDAGIAFEVPGRDELAVRLPPVLEAIYAAYGSGWQDVIGDGRLAGLAAEAIWLARVTVSVLPGEPEALGLLALMLYAEARREARRAADGSYVPLSQQDAARWSRPMLAEAERALATAAAMQRIGPYQLEAAIQSAYVAGALCGRTDRAAIAQLHEGLYRLAPTVGVFVARAAAIAEAFGPARGLECLAGADGCDAYQPYHATRAHLLRALGREAEARAAYDRAIGLTEEPAVRGFLLARRG